MGNAEKDDTKSTDNNDKNNAENDTHLNEKNGKLPRIHQLPLSTYSPTYVSLFPRPHAQQPRANDNEERDVHDGVEADKDDESGR